MIWFDRGRVSQNARDKLTTDKYQISNFFRAAPPPPQSQDFYFQDTTTLLKKV